MATPIGHGLIATGLSLLIFRGGRANNLKILALLVFAANVPDLDFLPGLISGDLNRYHQGITHSIFGLTVFLLVCAVFVHGMKASRDWLIWLGLAYGSHLVIDYFGTDNRMPVGMPLFWPVSSDFYKSSLDLLPGVRHGGNGADWTEFVTDLLSWANLQAIGVEFLVSLPVLIMGYVVYRRRMYLKNK